jgi:hypothetical protein
VVRLRLSKEKSLTISMFESIRGENRTERLSDCQSSIFILGAFVATLLPTHFVRIYSLNGSRSTRPQWTDGVEKVGCPFGLLVLAEPMVPTFTVETSCVAAPPAVA